LQAQLKALVKGVNFPSFVGQLKTLVNGVNFPSFAGQLKALVEDRHFPDFAGQLKGVVLLPVAGGAVCVGGCGRFCEVSKPLSNGFGLGLFLQKDLAV